MSDFNRGIMKFEGADSPLAIFLSASLIIGSITVLLWWGFHYAYI